MFQSLQYLRHVCNHPDLVLSPRGRRGGGQQHEYAVSASCKLLALQRLLAECGIGRTGNGDDTSRGTDSGRGIAGEQDDEGDDADVSRGDEQGDMRGATNTAMATARGAVFSGVVTPHRALVFAQVRSPQRVEVRHAEAITVSSPFPTSRACCCSCLLPSMQSSLGCCVARCRPCATFGSTVRPRAAPVERRQHDPTVCGSCINHCMRADVSRECSFRFCAGQRTV